MPPDFEIGARATLRGLVDEKTVRSLNGCRVTDQILKEARPAVVTVDAYALTSLPRVTLDVCPLSR